MQELVNKILSDHPHLVHCSRAMEDQLMDTYARNLVMDKNYSINTTYKEWLLSHHLKSVVFVDNKLGQSATFLASFESPDHITAFLLRYL